MNILFLVGSTRPDSLNSRLAEAAASLLPEGAHAQRWERLEELPFYTEERDAGVPSLAVADLRAAVAAADALVVVTPEYNASVPGILKNAIDWASRPRGAASLAGKPVAVLSATVSPGGSLSAREHATAILQRAGARPLPESVGIASAFRAFDNNRLVELADVDRVRALLAALDDELVAAA